MNKTPMISVITPSLNCAAYIRECIESVLAQNYDNFEHIIIDGASTDGTVEILRQYPHLKWVSEPDKGEAEALNKALTKMQGDIIGWLNADDYYVKGVFPTVAQKMDLQQGRYAIYGNTRFIDEQGKFILEKKSVPKMTLALLLRWWKHPRHPHQPSVFYSRKLMDDIGPFNSELYFSVDYEYWLRAIIKYKFYYVDQFFSCARSRTNCKTRSTAFDPNQSHWRVSLPYHRYLNPLGLMLFWTDYRFYILSFVFKGILRRLKILKNLSLK